MSDHYEYSTAEIAKFYGLTAKGLAYYEKEGIISPRRDENSSYRKYTLSDCYSMYHAKLYKNNGISLKKTSEILRDNDIHQILSELTYQQEIEERQMTIHARAMQKSKEMVQMIKDYETNGQTFQICDRPVFYRLYVRTFDWRHISSTEQSKEFELWNENIPIDVASLLYKKESVIEKKEKLNVNIGNIIEQDDMELLGFKTTPQVTMYPSRQCVRTILKGDGMTIDHIDWLNNTLAWIDQNGYELCDDIMTQMLLTTGIHAEHIRYDLAWFPIQPKEKP